MTFSKASIALVLGFAILLPSSYAQTANDFGAAAIQEKRPETTALDHYFAVGETAHFMCTMTYRLALAQSDVASRTPEEIAKADYRRCIALHKDAIKPTYNKANSALKSTRAKSLLKDHYALTLTHLDGIAPLANEPASRYSQRQDQVKIRLTELANRIRIEQ